MRKFLLVTAAAVATPILAYAATVALPGVVFTTPGSSAINCTQTDAANLVVPVAVGTVIFSCTVAPATWHGTVSLSGGPPFTLTAPIANAFNVTLSAAVTAAGTLQPGTLTTTP